MYCLILIRWGLLYGIFLPLGVLYLPYTKQSNIDSPLFRRSFRGIRIDWLKEALFLLVSEFLEHPFVRFCCHLRHIPNPFALLPYAQPMLSPFAQFKTCNWFFTQLFLLWFLAGIFLCSRRSEDYDLLLWCSLHWRTLETCTSLSDYNHERGHRIERVEFSFPHCLLIQSNILFLQEMWAPTAFQASGECSNWKKRLNLRSLSAKHRGFDCVLNMYIFILNLSFFRITANFHFVHLMLHWYLFLEDVFESKAVVIISRSNLICRNAVLADSLSSGDTETWRTPRFIYVQSHIC